MNDDDKKLLKRMRGGSKMTVDSYVRWMWAAVLTAALVLLLLSIYMLLTMSFQLVS